MSQFEHLGRPKTKWAAEAIAFGVLGLLVGSILGHGSWSALSGGALGILFAGWRSSRAEIEGLREVISEFGLRQIEIEGRLRGASADSASESEARLPDSEGDSERTRPAASTPPQIMDAEPDSPMSAEIGSSPESSREIAAAPSEESLSGAVDAAFAGRTDAREAFGPGAARSSAPSGPSLLQKGITAIRSFLFGGNTVVRVGLLVLLVGLTLLAKYAADNALFPVEARLGTAALVGIILVGFGYRQREDRPGFGMSLQGGGIAALYLVTFFAFKVYGLVPAELAFSLFVGLAVATVMLSLLQSSEPLLIIGSLGGFLAPILASTGEGSHVVLFSYYLMLNLSIAAVALRRAWRLSAVVAFICTYGIATTWGVLRYEAEFFGSTEPFVLANLGLFTGIAVAHMRRRPPELRGLIDGTLVFGTPFVSILLQSALVRDRELGLALSAAGFGVFYAALAVWLWRTAPRETRPLAEAFIAIAVGFATMAIPFAFDEALTTSVAWALEGAGLYWVGARQDRRIPRIAGSVLQGMAALAFWVSVVIENVDSSGFLPIANGRALSCMGLALAGLFIAQQSYTRRSREAGSGATLSRLFGAWGLLWWTGGVLVEIDQFVPIRFEVSAILIGIAATTAAIEIGAAWSRWELGRDFSLLGLPAAAVGFLMALDRVPHLLGGGGFLAWPLVFAAFYFVWCRREGREGRVESDSRELRVFRSGSLWLLAVVSACAVEGWVEEVARLTRDWQAAGFGVALVGILFGALEWSRRDRPPFDRDVDNSLTAGLGPIAIGCLLATAGLQFAADGDASPIPHLPLLNPVDLTVALLALAWFAWWKRVRPILGESIDARARQMAMLALVALAFLCLNGLLARAVHQWAGVDFNADALWNSTAMQVTLSIAWTSVGLSGMLFSSRARLRPLWMGCAGLLAVVVVKLFVVDLSQLSTVARIATFLVVGVLLLVLGFFSPVPPGDDDPVQESDRGEPESPMRGEVS